MTRREFFRTIGFGSATLAVSGVQQLPASGAARPAASAPESMTIIEFEETLARMRAEHYRHPKVDVIATGFRPVGGSVADFGVAERGGRYHFFYIERRPKEGTPFYPGHEIFFGHASTADFFDWEVHDPVMLVRPDTWEEAHVWAPCIVRRGDEYVMAYTGVNRYLSQNIGLASSGDLFTWQRWPSNPISPCKGRAWAFWRDDGIASCRDPELLEHDGRVWMVYTANTAAGAACVALAVSRDLKQWEDRGPILIGPASGYEPRLEGGHPQGSLESAVLLYKRGRWFLLFNAAIRGTTVRQWVVESDRPEAFDFAKRLEFWTSAAGVEVVKERGERSLVAGFTDGCIRFGQVDWSTTEPRAESIKTRQQLQQWAR